MLAELLGLVAPPRCAVCARECGLRAAAYASDASPGCVAWRRARRRFRGSTRAWSAAPYEGVARDLVVALKFAARLRLARRAAAVIAERAPADLLRGRDRPRPARAGAPATARVRRGGGDRRGARRRDRAAARALPAALAGAAPGGAPAGRAAGLPAARAPRRPAARRGRAGGRRGHHGRDAGCLRAGAAVRRLRPGRGADLRPVGVEPAGLAFRPQKRDPIQDRGTSMPPGLHRREEGSMRIEVRGRNTEVTDELRAPRREALRADRQAGLRAARCSRSS